MQTKFSNYDAVGLLETVKKELGIHLNTSCQRTEFYLPKKIGDGVISTYLFRDGLSFFHFNGLLKNDWEWRFTCEEDSPFLAFFSLSGEVEDREIGKTEGNFVLKPLDTLIVLQPGGVDRSMVFKKGASINMAILRVDAERYFTKKACSPTELPKVMRPLLTGEKEFVRQYIAPNKFTPITAKIVKEMEECTHTGLARTCFIEAKCREWLAVLMHQLGLERMEEEVKKVDCKTMEKAKELLLEDMQNPPTILDLSRLVGMNQQQLKKDFKIYFEKTIYQYLLTERMETAEKLIVNTDMPILEVAIAVGYQNAGHFAKRFYEYFGMLPSKYKMLSIKDGQEN